jgi:hypothetical protein
MKKNDTEVSRRAFLSRSAVAAGTSIIAIQAVAPPEAKAGVKEANQMFTNELVYTESTQTLTNKTIAFLSNNLIIGTDAVNVKEFLPSGTDITTALNSAISYLHGSSTSGNGGVILIPRGVWTMNGGHELKESIL